MYEMAKSARADMKAKAKRMATPNSGAIDASGWTEPTDMHAGAQTGMKPVSRRNYARGGKIAAMLGDDARPNAGRKPRASGGKAIIDDYMNRDEKEANRERPGVNHNGGYKRGGAPHKSSGGDDEGYFSGAGRSAPEHHIVKALKNHGFEHSYRNGVLHGHMPTYNHHTKESGMEYHPIGNSVHKLKGFLGYKEGGRTGKADGGPTAGDLVPTQRFGFHPTTSKLAQSAGMKRGGKPHKGLGGLLPIISPLAALLTGGKKDKDDDDSGPSLAVAKKAGGSAHAKGCTCSACRSAKASGGSADEKQDKKLIKSMVKGSSIKKDKCGGGATYARGGGTSLDGEIQGTRPVGGRLARAHGGRNKGKTTVNVIIGQPPQGQQAQPPMPMPPAPVPMPPRAMPPGPPPAGAGPMPVPPAGAPPMPPGMPRKSGGRTMAGAGSGPGRLQKTAMQKRVYP